MSNFDDKVDAIFEAAAGLENKEQRSAYLDRACPDPKIREAVESRLSSQNTPEIEPVCTSNPVLAQPTIEIRLEEAPNDENIGDSHGRYKILEKIGEGGCGVVYVAEQTEPVRRRVALKIIKLGMDTKQVVARFEAERQALAMMEHANIARVFDAGSTATGRPYFVMELVRGIRITDYCDQNNLSTDQRLELFMQVCHAIQHAHQKGIIHRDIKPSNILVTVRDGMPVPKVIDFGIAKATEGKLTDATVYTQLNQFIGTPAYMSPEQAEMSGLDIDTRSDIYSLGVLLYELLSGKTPFDAKELVAQGIDAIRKTIRETDPLRPSTKVAGLKQDELTTTAKRRASIAPRLIQELKGDLDWIVMKCLEKDRQRRYETANSLAEDLKHHLSGEPVTAAPPSTSYRLRKFLQRHKVETIAAGIIGLALVLGLAGTIWQAKIASRQRDKARTEAQRALAAETQEHRRAEELQRVADFQGALLSQIDVAAAGLRLTKDVRDRFEAALLKAGVAETDRATQSASFAGQWSRVNATDSACELIDSTILTPALVAIDKQFSSEPLIAATLRHSLAERYDEIGLDKTAADLEEKTLADLRRVAGEDHALTIESLNHLAEYRRNLGELDVAEKHFREALERTRRVKGADHPDTLSRMDDLGGLLLTKSQLSDAEPYIREALEKRRRILGEEHRDTLVSINQLAALRRDQGKLAEAEIQLRDLLTRRRRVLGENDQATLTTINDLATILQSQGKLDEAIGYFREALQKRRQLLGEGHPATLRAAQNLGAVLDKAGQSAEAESILSDTLAKQRQTLGPDHFSTLITMGNFSVFLINKKKFADAEPLCRETLERRSRVLGTNHTATLVACNVMGLVLIKQKKFAEGAVYWREALNVSRRVLGPDHPETLIYTHNLGSLASDQQEFAEAEQLLNEVIKTGSASIGAGHPTVLSATRKLGHVFFETKRYQEAVDLLSNAEPTARKSLTGSSTRDLAPWLEDLGNSRAMLQTYSLAETNLIEANAIYSKAYGSTNVDARPYVKSLFELYSAWDNSNPGKNHDIQQSEWKTKLDAFPAKVE